MKNWIAFLVSLCLVLSLGTCMAETAPIPVTLADSGVVCDAAGVTVSGSVVTFSAPGEYELTGALSNGQLVVDCDAAESVTLILNNVTIHNETGAAIFIKQAQKHVYITLAEGSVNALSGGETYTLDDKGEPDGVLFSKDDFTIEGSGALSVTAAYMDGIVSKDDLTIKDGTITVVAARNGVKGKDSVRIKGGVLHITAGNDGVKATNEKDPEKGYVEITGGEVHITCEDDPISAVTRLSIYSGLVDATITGTEK